MLEINNGIEEILKGKKIRADAAADVWKRTAKKSAAKRKLKKYALLSIPLAVLLFVIILNIKLMQDEPSISKLVDDHEYIFFLDFFVLYSTLRIAYKVWSRRRRMR